MVSGGVIRSAGAAGPAENMATPLNTYTFPTSVKKLVRREDGSMGIKLRSTPELNNSQTTVQGVEPNGPAQQAGIRRGHVLIEINGVCILGWSHENVVETIKTTNRDVIRLRVCPAGCFPSQAAIRRVVRPPSISKRKHVKTKSNSSADSSSPYRHIETPVKKALKVDVPASRKLEYSPKSTESASSFRPGDFSSDQEVSDQVKGLLGIFKALSVSGGLTDKGHRLLNTIGLTEIIQNYGIVRDSGVGDPGVESELNLLTVPSRSRTTEVRKRVASPSASLSRGSSACNSPSTHRVYTADPDNTYQHSKKSRQGPKDLWPIDGRRSKLPSKKSRSGTQPTGTTDTGMRVVALHTEKISGINGFDFRESFPMDMDNQHDEDGGDVEFSAPFARDFTHIRDEDFRVVPKADHRTASRFNSGGELPVRHWI